MQGQCFPWSTKYIMDHPNSTLCHAVVTQPFQLPPDPYVHAWVEDEIGGIVTCLDWQTMEGGHGGNWRGRGFPKVIFFALFHPERIHSYTFHEALELMLESRSLTSQWGHSGPWTDDFNDVIFDQLQRQKARQA